MEESLEDQIRAAHILQGAAFGAMEVPLSAALIASLTIQGLALVTAPGPRRFSWGIMMVASTSLGWGIAHTLRQEVFNQILENRRAAKGSSNTSKNHKSDDMTIEIAEELSGL